MTQTQVIYVRGFGVGANGNGVGFSGVDTSGWRWFAQENLGGIIAAINAVPVGMPILLVGESFGGATAIAAAAAVTRPIAKLVLFDPVNHNMACGSGNSGGPNGNAQIVNPGWQLSANIGEAVCFWRNPLPPNNCPYSSPIAGPATVPFLNIQCGRNDPASLPGCHVADQVHDLRAGAAIRAALSGASMIAAVTPPPAPPDSPDGTTITSTARTIYCGGVAYAFTASGQIIIGDTADSNTHGVIGLSKQPGGNLVQITATGFWGAASPKIGSPYAPWQLTAK